MSERTSAFSEVRKRTVDVIDLEPSSMVEPKGKGIANPAKRRAESGNQGGKLMADAIKGTRTSKRLADAVGGTSSGATGKVWSRPLEGDKGNQGEGVYIPC